MADHAYDPENAPIATSTRVPSADEPTDDDAARGTDGGDSAPIVTRTRAP